MRNYDPVALAATFYTLVCFTALVYTALFTKENVFGLYWSLVNNGYGVYVLFNIILYTTAPILYWNALKRIPASDTSILYSFIGVHTLWLGLLFFGKTIGLYALAGIAILFLSQLIANWKNDSVKFGKFQIYMVMATLLYAAAFLTDNQILSSHDISVTGYMVIRFLFPSFFLFLFWPKRIREAKEVFRYKGSSLFLFINTMLMFGSYFFAYVAYELGASAPAIASILGLESLMIVFLENIFIGRIPHYHRKIFAAMLAVGGIIFLSM